ncbi:Uncharacterised protein [Mycobacteroides abscessus subsp. massiliense]|nr:Uncharacterised protein [Mycobacteroides abscessus subsp. massiliense]
MDVLDHVGRGRAECVGDQSHLGVAERDLHLGCRGGLGPAQQLQGVVVTLLDRHAVVCQQLAAEVQVFLRNHRLEHLGELLGRHVRVHALVFIGDDDVDAVRVIADVLVDPVQLDLELLRGESDGAQDAEASGLTYRDDNIAAVGEGENRELDAELVADGGVHGHSSGGWWERVSGRPKTGTCSSLDQVLRTRAAASLHSR